MPCRPRLLVLLVLLTSGAVCAQAQEAEPDSGEPRAAQQAGGREADDGDAQPARDAAGLPPDDYEASEQISEDLSVSFPVDI